VALFLHVERRIPQVARRRHQFLERTDALCPSRHSRGQLGHQARLLPPVRVEQGLRALFDLGVILAERQVGARGLENA
jgi:hypothetical protein